MDNGSEETVNLENCAREPIHIPGAIQPHGLLFVLREPDLAIVQTSENVESVLGLSVESVLEQGLSAFLSAEQIDHVRFALESLDPRDNNPVELQLPTQDGRGAMDGFVHRHDGFSFLELELASLTYNARFLEFYKTISKLTSKLHAAPTMDALLRTAVDGVREMTGFDRVMLYRFSPSYEGEVIAEAKVEDWGTYLGLWFPASDIPEQARRLYVANPIRNIVDATYEPVAIVPVINPESRRPVDLSYAGLRSVSPIHCEYLQNMGVAASMSISIVRDDRLWGLIACHHRTPRPAPYEVRRACTFIGQVVSSEIARREAEEESRYASNATIIQAKFLELMAGNQEPLQGLINSSPNLLDFIPCDGAAVVASGKADMLGFTPDFDELTRLVKKLHSAGVASTFHTSALKHHFSINEALRSTASGLIALEVERDPATWVFFFRSEKAQKVTWGGNPNKPVEQNSDSFRLSPRKSFEAWEEEVHGHALPWNRLEIKAAGELRNLISVVTYGKGERGA